MNQAEQILQSKCFQWHWNNFPQERGLLHANNNNSSDRNKGALNMAIGVVPGVADMEYVANGVVIFIEMKTPTGTQSDAQKKFQEQVESRGHMYVVCRTEEEFKALIYAQQR